MRLSDWVGQHRSELIEVVPTTAAIGALLAVLEREIRDAAGVPSDDGRLEHAFAACLAVGRAALAASGYRLRSGASGHHYLALESLILTLKISEDELDQLQGYRRMRSRAMYEQVGIVTATEARMALATAHGLQERLSTWLAQEHLDLTGDSPCSPA